MENTVGREIHQHLRGLDGLVLVYPDIEIPGFWHPESWRSEITKSIFTQAQELSIAVLFNAERGNLVSDKAWMNKIRITRDNRGNLREYFHHVSEHNFSRMAEVIRGCINKKEQNITLGFGGGMAISCVRRVAHALCRTVVESSDPKKLILDVTAERSRPGKKFGRGEIIYQFTDDVDLSFYSNRHSPLARR